MHELLTALLQPRVDYYDDSTIPTRGNDVENELELRTSAAVQLHTLADAL